MSNKPHRGFIVYVTNVMPRYAVSSNKPHRGFVVYRAGLPSVVRLPCLWNAHGSNVKRCEAHPFPPKGRVNELANRLDSPPLEGLREA